MYGFIMFSILGNLGVLKVSRLQKSFSVSISCEKFFSRAFKFWGDCKVYRLVGYSQAIAF